MNEFSMWYLNQMREEKERKKQKCKDEGVKEFLEWLSTDEGMTIFVNKLLGD
jgi:hypothetical protein